MVVATWRDIEAAMTPIIGRGSVAVLYLRSLHLASLAHPWLSAAQDTSQSDMDLVTLSTVLSGQNAIEAAATGGTLLQSFYELLASLVGLSLTEQLLRTVWANLPASPPAQDTTP